MSVGKTNFFSTPLPVQKLCCRFLTSRDIARKMTINSAFKELFSTLDIWKKKAQEEFPDAVERASQYGLSIGWYKFCCQQIRIHSNIENKTFKIINFGNVKEEYKRLVCTSKFFIFGGNNSVTLYDASIEPDLKESPSLLRQITVLAKDEDNQDLQVDASANILVTCSEIETRVWNLNDFTELCSFSGGTSILLRGDLLLLNRMELINWKTKTNTIVSKDSRAIEMRNNKVIIQGRQTNSLICSSLEDGYQKVLEEPKYDTAYLTFKCRIIADQVILSEFGCWGKQNTYVYNLIDGKKIRKIAAEIDQYNPDVEITDRRTFQLHNQSLTIRTEMHNKEINGYNLKAFNNKLSCLHYAGTGRVFVLGELKNRRSWQLFCLDFQ